MIFRIETEREGGNWYATCSARNDEVEGISNAKASEEAAAKQALQRCCHRLRQTIQGEGEA